MCTYSQDNGGPPDVEYFDNEFLSSIINSGLDDSADIPGQDPTALYYKLKQRRVCGEYLDVMKNIIHDIAIRQVCHLQVNMVYSSVG